MGKPVYLVADVALLPLTSEREANEAIKDALASHDIESDVSDSEQSDHEDAASHKTSTTEVGSLPSDDHRPFSGESDSTSNVARQVATGNVSFGRFATQWLSGQKWPVSKPGADRTSIAADEPRLQTTQASSRKQDAVPSDQPPDAPAVDPTAKSQQPLGTATMGLLPRIMKTTKMIFTSRSYFFSYDLDLTRRLEKLGRLDQPMSFRDLDPLVSSGSIREVHH